MFETMEIGWLRLGQKSLDQRKVRRMTTSDAVHPITAMVERSNNPDVTLEIEIKGDPRLNDILEKAFHSFWLITHQ